MSYWVKRKSLFQYATFQVWFLPLVSSFPSTNEARNLCLFKSGLWRGISAVCFCYVPVVFIMVKWLFGLLADSFKQPTTKPMTQEHLTYRPNNAVFC